MGGRSVAKSVARESRDVCTRTLVCLWVTASGSVETRLKREVPRSGGGPLTWLANGQRRVRLPAAGDEAPIDPD